MKKHNPVKQTVTRVVSAGKWKREKKPKMTVRDFFDDLENRGTLHPKCLVEKWAKKIRRDMVRAKTWIGDDENPELVLSFVAEYVRRLQDEFWKSHCRRFKQFRSDFTDRSCRRYFSWSQFRSEVRAFLMLYKQIRVWGLRTKRFRLRSNRRVSVNLGIETYVGPHPSTMTAAQYPRGDGEYYDKKTERAYIRSVIPIFPTRLVSQPSRNARVDALKCLAWCEMFAWGGGSKENLRP